MTSTLKMGNLVRFAHEHPDGPLRRVVSVMADGMVEVSDFGGYFAPDLFVAAEEPQDLAERFAAARQILIDEAIAACDGCGGREFPKRPDCPGCTDHVDERIDEAMGLVAVKAARSGGTRG